MVLHSQANAYVYREEPYIATEPVQYATNKGALACHSCQLSVGTIVPVGPYQQSHANEVQAQILAIEEPAAGRADDYAHHPKELEVTLETAMKMGYNKVWAVFQPFTYSRTKMLLNEFAISLQLADKVVMTEIMGSREVNTIGIYTKDLAELIPGSVWFEGFDGVVNYVKENVQPGDLVITLGCGDIYKAAKMMLKEF